MVDKCEECIDCKDCDDKVIKGDDGPGCLFAIIAAIGVSAILAIAGCMTPEQASRSTNATYGDIDPTVKTEIGAGAVSNSVAVTVKITFGDGAIASADSSGSTESQTQTPTFDISPKTDLRYNDALAAASTTSRGVIDSLVTASANNVLSLMADKITGTVQVQKKDGSTATVKCEGGQCSFCTGCEVK